MSSAQAAGISTRTPISTGSDSISRPSAWTVRSIQAAPSRPGASSTQSEKSSSPFSSATPATEPSALSSTRSTGAPVITSQLSFIVSYIAPRIYLERSVPMWRIVAGMMSSPACRARAITRFARSPLGSKRVLLAPWRRYVSSASAISESSFSRPQYSSRFPPNSGVRVSFPSLKAPAPPQPQTTLQGRHWTHSGLPSFIGHFLLSMERPLSMMMTFFPLLASSIAAKSPAGPAPTIIAS